MVTNSLHTPIRPNCLTSPIRNNDYESSLTDDEILLTLPLDKLKQMYQTEVRIENENKEESSKLMSFNEDQELWSEADSNKNKIKF